MIEKINTYTVQQPGVMDDRIRVNDGVAYRCTICGLIWTDEVKAVKHEEIPHERA